MTCAGVVASNLENRLTIASSATVKDIPRSEYGRSRTLSTRAATEACALLRGTALQLSMLIFDARMGTAARATNAASLDFRFYKVVTTHAVTRDHDPRFVRKLV